MLSSSAYGQNSDLVPLSTQVEPSWPLPPILGDGRARSRLWKRPPEARLMRVLRVQIGKVFGEFKQIVGKRHASCHDRLIEFGLLGLATEVKVGKDAPSFQGLNLLLDGL